MAVWMSSSALVVSGIASPATVATIASVSRSSTAVRPALARIARASGRR
jgi:hypothetical protein